MGMHVRWCKRELRKGRNYQSYRNDILRVCLAKVWKWMKVDIKKKGSIRRSGLTARIQFKWRSDCVQGYMYWLQKLWLECIGCLGSWRENVMLRWAIRKKPSSLQLLRRKTKVNAKFTLVYNSFANLENCTVWEDTGKE